MLDLSKIRAISLDLDDTLWPVWPAIERAETTLHNWLAVHAPQTAAAFSSPAALRAIRMQMEAARPDLRSDLSALRRESIRLALQHSGENPALAEAAFDVFFDARQRVVFYDDALPAMDFLSGRYPLVALSNGNADIQRVGLGAHFKAALSAQAFGVGKPDPRIFHAAASAVDVLPHEVLHVGDDAALDAVGALNAGMQAVWLNRGGHPWTHDETPHATVTSLAALCDLFS